MGEILAEEKRIKDLSKKLVDEEHHDKELATLLKYAEQKYKQTYALLVMNDANHKKTEADLLMTIESTKEERDRDQVEMKVAVENALAKVEAAKIIAKNAKAISNVMDTRTYGLI